MDTDAHRSETKELSVSISVHPWPKIPLLVLTSYFTVNIAVAVTVSDPDVPVKVMV